MREVSPQEQLELLTRTAVQVETREELLEKLRLGRPLRVKAGFDPSAPDIHIGHSIPLDVLRTFQELGHKVVIIVGDFTARVGDPSGKIKSRPTLSEEEVEANARTYFQQVGKIIDVEKAEVRGNAEWLADLDFAGVLRLTASYTVARMLERDTFAKRMAQGEAITITEMLYPLMQGYDSVAIEADVEIGGTDQTFNLLAARDVQRFYGQPAQVIMTFPLLVGLDGVEKMSKSLGNGVGITDPPDDMFGKIMSIPDSIMLDYYRLLLKTPEDELAEMGRCMKAGDVNPRDVKLDLAQAIVRRYHGEQASAAARDEFIRRFSHGELPSEIRDLVVSPDELSDGQIALAVLVARIEDGMSRSQARRLITQGAVTVDGQPIRDAMAAIEPRDGMILKAGKRRIGRIEIR